MFVMDGIAYAGEPTETLKVASVKVVDELYMIVTFSTGEKRIFDAKSLLKYPVYQLLSEPEIFKHAVIEHGILTWDNGNIDIAPETLYNLSIAYETELVENF